MTSVRTAVLSLLLINAACGPSIDSAPNEATAQRPTAQYTGRVEVHGDAVYIDEPALRGSGERPTKLFVNRYGGTFYAGAYDDALTNRSRIIRDWNPNSTVQMPAWNGTNADWNYIMTCVRGILAPYQIQVVDERPSTGVYSMVNVGGVWTTIAPNLPSGAFGGLALMSAQPFTRGLAWVVQSNNLTVTCENIAHEWGHNMTLEHKLDCNDVMAYASCSNKTFVNASGPCGETTQTTCVNSRFGTNTQNSHQILAQIINKTGAVTWSGWSSLGTGGSAPAVTNNSDGRLEAFITANGGFLLHRWQVVPNGNFTGWSTLDNGPITTAPVAILDPTTSSIFVSAFSQSSYLFAYQGTSAGFTVNITNPPAGTPMDTAVTHAMAVGASRDVLSFFRGSDGALWRYSRAANNWQSLGGSLKAGTVGGPTAVVNADGRVEVFVVAPNGTVQHTYENTPGGTWGTWLNRGGAFKGRLAAILAADGRIELFGWGTDNRYYRAYQLTPGGSWSAWSVIGAYQFSTPPAIARNGDARLELFGIGTGNELAHAWQTTENGNWSSWAVLGGSSTCVQTASNYDGRIEVFTCGTDGNLYHLWELF